MRKQQQLALPIGQVEVPEHLLREAYRRSGLKREFDEVMQIRHLSISLKHEAVALGSMGRKRKCANT
jgi:hypothetical protein